MAGTLEINIDTLPGTLVALVQHGKAVNAVNILALCIQSLTKMVKAQQKQLDEIKSHPALAVEEEKGN